MVIIRAETATDCAAVYAVHKAAFPTHAEAQLVGRLRESQHLTISIVAELQGIVVGHIAFSPVTNSDDLFGLGMAPVAVTPEYQRRGIGAKLVEAGLAEAAKRGIRYVVVLGDPQYYGRFGFKPASRWGLENEYGAGEAFQAIELTASATSHPGGLIKYGAEFSARSEEPAA